MSLLEATENFLKKHKDSINTAALLASYIPDVRDAIFIRESPEISRLRRLGMVVRESRAAVHVLHTPAEERISERPRHLRVATTLGPEAVKPHADYKSQAA